MAAVSALLQPTALGHTPVTDPQLHSKNTQRPGRGVQEQCKAPSQVNPLRGCPQRAHPEPLATSRRARALKQPGPDAWLRLWLYGCTGLP